VSSCEPQGPIDDLLAAGMGRLSMFLLKGQMVMGSRQICSTCLDNHASEVLARLLECPVKASGKSLEFIVLASLLYNF
jgi:hypothetical protein